jgi:hypothetical protein
METQPVQEKIPAFLKMYEIPGREKITEHSFERYLKNKENFPKDIPRSIPTETPASMHLKEITTGSAGNNQREFEEKAGDLPINEIPEFIREGLKTNDPELRKFYIRQIGRAHANERADILTEAFEIDNEDVQMECVKTISNIPENERMKLLRIGLSKNHLEVKKASIKMIQYAPEELRAKLIRAGLTENDPKLQRTYAKVIRYVPEEKDRKELLALAKQKLGNALVEPSLYDDTQISKENFSREELKKSGSGTTLIGGELKDKVIFRHITPTAFLSWQEVYEDHEMWKKAGFDYVPIEPIVSFRMDKEGLVDVASGVLDLSLNSWIGMSGDFSRELIKQKEKIKNILTEAGIKHGHPHGDNFCLRFFRKENGDVNFNKMPRIYLIDFDRAVS